MSLIYTDTFPEILEAFHHPYYHVGRSRIQQEMFEEMEKWIGGLGPEEAERIIECLTKVGISDAIIWPRIYIQPIGKRQGGQEQTRRS